MNGGATGECVDESASDEGWTAIAEQREEERFALEAIYEDSFSERIKSRVWTVSLELPKLTELAKQHTSGVKGSQHASKTRTIDPSVCKHFLKNRCRFGDKCRFKHQVLYKETSEPEVAEEERPDTSTWPYQVEVRFPHGNRYPAQAPLVAFSSTNPLLAPRVCLNITTRLMREAKSVAQSELPVVFTLISLLEDDDVIVELFSNPPHR